MDPFSRLNALPFYVFLDAIFGSLLVVCLFRLVRKALKRSSYAHLRGPNLTSQLGYLLDLHSETSLIEYHYAMTEKFGHVARLRGGIFGLQKDALYIADPLALNSVLVRDQDNFTESTEFSGLFGIIHHGSSLATVSGPDHKKQRRILNPIFTAKFVSKLAPVFYGVAHQLRDKLADDVRGHPDGHTVDILDHLTRAALEMISQGGLGHTFHSFDEQSQEFEEFHRALQTVLPTAGKLFFVLPFLESWRKLRPVWLRRLLAGAVGYLPWPSARQFKWTVDTMYVTCRVLFYQKRAMLEGGRVSDTKGSTGVGKDLVTVLMSANADAGDGDKMPDGDIIANMSSIVLGGQETTSGALSRLLCLMVQDVDLQARLRAEVTGAYATTTDNYLSYKELNSLPVLDAVCREALRLFSPVTFVWRETKEDCVVPLQFPLRDTSGAEIHEVLITKGTSVYIGLAAANRSAAIWGKDVNELRPERWLGKNIADATSNGVKVPGIFSNIMTFLGGGRACPGMKFALLEIKIVLSVLLTEFEFQAVPEEIDWRQGITVVPYVKGKEKLGPSVPMTVKLIKP